MNELQVKQVDFFGDTLLATQDNDGVIWAGMRWMCNGLGMTERQQRYQVTLIKNDKVLSKGGQNFVLPTNGGKQEVFCLKLDFVPMWLAKINITPTMEIETPNLAEKMERYQLKAKDVLAAAFLPQSKPTSPAELMLQQAQLMVDMEKRVAQIQADTEDTRRKVDALSDNPAYWRQETDRKIKEIASREHMAERLLRRDLYAELERITGVKLKNRLTRLRNRAKKQGALYATCNAMTRLDVIAQSKQLRREFDCLLKGYDTQIEQVM